MKQSTFKSRLKYEIPLAAVFAAIFAFLCVYTIQNPVNAFDEAVHDAFVNIRVPFLNPVIVLISYSGNWQTITAVCAILLLIRKTRRHYGLPLSCACLSCVGIYQAAKYLMKRPRPDHAYFLLEQSGYSFPSGHALTAVVFFLLLAMIIQTRSKAKDTVSKNRGWAILCVVWALLIGLSRLYVGVHWATDILGGWCLSVIVILIFSEIFKVGFASGTR